MFRRLDAAAPEDNVIFLIKDYIAKHYGSDLLSIKEISDYARFYEKIFPLSGLPMPVSICDNHPNILMLPNQIKDAYYRLFNALNDCRQKWKLSADSAGTDSSESIIEYLENCFQ